MSDWTSALAVPADLAEASASLSRRTRAAAAGGSYDLAVVCAVGAAACSLDASAITAARALACAGGAAYFSLQLVERARLALLSSEALAAAGCIFDAECDAGWRLPLAALKLVLYAAATADSETHAYFLGAQLELAWALLDRPPPPPPPPPRRGWPGALRRWWRARTGRSGFGKEEI